VTNSSFDLVTIYLLLVTKTGALYLDVFEQPEELALDWEPVAGRKVAEPETHWPKKKRRVKREHLSNRFSTGGTARGIASRNLAP
jgi:hypothetical protein